MNEFIEHPTIMYCCYDAEIINIDGNFYVQEDYQEGSIWSDDEIWGSKLYDLENKRKIESYYCIIDNEKDWKWYFDNLKWEEMDYEFEDWHLYGDAIEYYQNEINKLKQK